MPTWHRGWRFAGIGNVISHQRDAAVGRKEERTVAFFEVAGERIVLGERGQARLAEALAGHIGMRGKKAAQGNGERRLGGKNARVGRSVE